jgi:hypothetical protein
MKKIIYATIALFFIILIVVIIIAERNPVRTVKYDSGIVIEEKK